MGLVKNDGYTIKGVKITPAYAKLTRVYMENGNNASAYFGLSNSRENLNNGDMLDEIHFSCEIDKVQDKVFNEIYTKAKAEIFNGWTDDIVK